MSGEFYLLQKWWDPRCKFQPLPAPHTPNDRLTMFSTKRGDSHPGLKNLWQPDTQVMNSRKSSVKETIIHIWSSGQV